MTTTNFVASRVQPGVPTKENKIARLQAALDTTSTTFRPIASTGGRDLVFPHHENELAQSQAACGCGRNHGSHQHQHEGHNGQGAQQQQQQQDGEQLHNGTDFVRYWLHNGFVNVDSEKMSKSLGNFFTIRCARFKRLVFTVGDLVQRRLDGVANGKAET